MTLTDAQFEQYQRDGYVVVEDCLDGATVEAVTTRIESYVRNDREETGFNRMLEPDVDADSFEDGDPVRKFEGIDMVREDDVFADLVHDEAIVDVVEQLQGPNLHLLRSAAMLKPPRVGSEKKFHQDAAYYPIHPMDHVTVWIALDQSTTENGCMQVVPGAHTDGLLGHEAVEYDTDIAIAEADYGPEDAVALPMDPGDVLFQHCLLPHYTAPNETEDWRRAYIASYMRSRSRFTDENPPEWVDSYDVTGESFAGCV
ncbi:phytanoyl-CoA dioxygenase family protein [Haloarcula sp. JP-L23]|uniref:phytanoyl-CoA dioxygenase family protein n=1 Tax=Haloarcula sp. JP-L23 TaxID=2716717 RepID=UPI00140F27A4|nr:phytanoyl-CoA dioxygenase family protein [Haloarcula sp. JP-L23]